MMGQRPGAQDKLFYSFSLNDYVPPSHLLRGIDQVLDLRQLRTRLVPFYSHTGRPSIDPELILRMLIVGYCLGIRSERRLCEEVHLSLAYRWLCRLELDEPVPNHSTFSRNRHGRFRANDTLRCLFEAVLRRCMSEGLVGGEALPQMPASSGPTPTERAAFLKARRPSGKSRVALRVSTWIAWRRATLWPRMTTRTQRRREGTYRSPIRQRTERRHRAGHRSTPTRPTP